jgi:NAD(P)-dependent dehydrogenase (short-subunit alcohol dehydrogenase family)
MDHPDFRLDGKVAIITGATRGIGRGLAVAMADAGATIAAAGRDEALLGEVVTEIESAGGTAAAFPLDVSDVPSIEPTFTQVRERFGSLDILVNNAGFMGRTAPLWELSDEDWLSVIRVNLSSVFYVSRAAIRPMREQGRGAIVSVASIAGKEGTPNLIPYTVTKAGIIAFTKALGKEVIRQGIRVNCVAPAVVETPLLDQLPREAIDLMLSKAPMGRFGTAEEVAGVVHFLASDDASFITAQCFDCSGGRATY